MLSTLQNGISLAAVQKQFPQVGFLKSKGQVYLDNAATTLKHRSAIDEINRFYCEETANIHRGDHYLSERATTKFEHVRKTIGNIIGADCEEEIIFNSGTTEGINFIARSLESYFKPGDTILLTELEHHSNLLPWQELVKRKDLNLEFIPVTNQGVLDLDFLKRLTQKTKVKLLSFSYYSNVTGIRSPIVELLAWARDGGVLTLIDSAQAMALEPINVKRLGCDFLVFSAHKLFSPTGVGVLYVKKEHHNKLKPVQFGGGMVQDVGLKSCKLSSPPHCFEAGTMPIEGVLALGAVLEHFLMKTNLHALKKQQEKRLLFVEEELKRIKDLGIVGHSCTKKNILSFVIEGLHPRDLGVLISQNKVAVRSGHHCAIPLMKKLGLPTGTVRASFSVYNDDQDAVCLIESVKKAKRMLT